MARCLIGCGSNLGKRREQLDRALELLRFMPGVQLLGVSRYRETSPVGGPAGQGPFLNGACLIETDLAPRDVLGMLLAVENTLHRERTNRWGERTIDLDLLLYDDLVVESADLTLPHPRMATHRFVLEPCVEIAPDLRYPPAACTVSDLLDNISAPHPLVAVVGVPGSGASEVASAVADALMARVIHAPEPLPCGDGPAGPRTERWWRTLASWAEPLDSHDWHDDPHGTITDYWLDALRCAAADDLDGAGLARFEAECDRVAAGTMAPHVAILLTAAPAVLEERIVFRGRQAAEHTNVFADLSAAATLCASPAASAAALVRLQDRLVRRLRSPGERLPRAPKAVIAIDSGDLVQAAADATAAVEAML